MLSDKERAIILNALINAGERGLTNHQAYQLLRERHGLTVKIISSYLKEIGDVVLDKYGKPIKVGKGKAHVYVYKNPESKEPDWIEKDAEKRSRWLVETAKKFDT